MGSSGAITAPASPVNLTTVAAGVVLANKLAAGDANPAFQILGDGTLRWGAGGVSATDTVLQRSAVLRLDMPGLNGANQGITVDGLGGVLVGKTAGNQYGIVFGNDVNLARVAGGVLGTSGELDVAGELKITNLGSGIRVKEGANARMGVATLVAGAVTVANTTITATTRIFLTNDTPGGAPGFLRVSATVVGTSFTITSSSGTDTSTVAWLLLEPG